MSRDTTAAAPATMAHERKSMLGVGAATLVGSALEWYDFYLYGIAAALVFNKIIFVNSNPTVATLAAFATFAVGYLIRPLGGLIFGRIGDTLGRKSVLVITLMVMGVATFLMAFIPTYEQVGIWAPITLVALRLVQGIGAGAEFGGAAIFSVEHADPRRRGLHGAWPATGVYLGLLLASGVFAIVTTLPEPEFLAWGWRIPFLLSAVVVVVALIIRLRLTESPAFLEIKKADHSPSSPIREVFTNEKKAMLTLFFAQVPQNVVSTLNLAFITTYLVGNLKLASSVGPLATTIGSATTMMLLPVFGYLSDKIGRRPVMLTGIVFSAVFAFPYFWLIDSQAPLPITIAIVLSLGIGVGAMFGPQAAYFSELFTGGARFTGLAFARETAGAATAGTTPLIAVALVAATGGATWAVSLFVIAACIIGAIAVILGGETRGRRMSATTVTELKGSEGSFAH
ncbi:MFS transporter [Rhodococcus globerulus]|uniref:MFS transporter n=1 Tax=Rhodococcus globerulus TaxID=33008 RepID=A0ABU4C3U0_RHOGO|nr:MFS transporter [Rhodococcus globerulus]MDV6271169.1 MFS transporter [Rhodococcus globerulus]